MLQVVCFEKGPDYEPGDKREETGEGEADAEKPKNPAANKQLVFFSNEKNFSRDQKVNRENNKWLSADISKVPIMMATKFPAAVMVVGMVSNKGATRVTSGPPQL